MGKNGKHNLDYDLASLGDATALTEISGLQIKDMSEVLPDNYFNNLKSLVDKHTNNNTSLKSTAAYRYKLEILQRALNVDRVTLIENIILSLNEYGVKYTARYFGFPSDHRFTWLDRTGEKKSTGIAILTKYRLFIYINLKTPDWVKKCEIMRPQFDTNINPKLLTKVILKKGSRIQSLKSEIYHIYQ